MLSGLSNKVGYFESNQAHYIDIIITKRKLLIAVADLNEAHYLSLCVNHRHVNCIFKQSLLALLFMIVSFSVRVNQVVYGLIKVLLCLGIGQN